MFFELILERKRLFLLDLTFKENVPVAHLDRAFAF